MALLIQCRRHGVFDDDRPHSPPYAQNQIIPKTIVQFWNNPDIPPDIARLIQSWGRCEGFEHLILNDQSAMVFIEAHCTVRVLKAFRTANHPPMRPVIPVSSSS